MASDNADSLVDRQFESYSDLGHEMSLLVTLSATPGVITTITLPANVKGIKLYPRTTDIRFAVSSTASVRVPVAEAASSSLTITASSAFALGAVAKADMWEKRLLHSNTGRSLKIMSATASGVVEVEIF